MSKTRAIEESKRAPARAAAYGLIAHGLQFPDQDTVATLADPKRWEDWPDALQDSDGRIRESLQAVRDSVSRFTDDSDADPQNMQHQYDDLFGHAVRGDCPAYEMEYGRNEIIRQASDLADLAGFYRAFGMEIAADATGRPDHITAECEFMSALCLKEAYAQAQGDDDNATVCVDAQRTFLRDHLARWLPAFAHRIRSADPKGFYGSLARFAEAFVAAECQQFDVHAGPQTLELKPPDPVLDREISCGTAGCGETPSGEQLIQLGMPTENAEEN